MRETETYLLHQLVCRAAERQAHAAALTLGNASVKYEDLAASVLAFASGLIGLGLTRGQRVAIYLEKRFETVTAFFGTSASGGTFVPINPLLKSQQVCHVTRDCGAGVLVTSTDRWLSLHPSDLQGSGLKHVVLVDNPLHLPVAAAVDFHRWADVLNASPAAGHRVVDNDMAAILYTSGSTGRPKGVVLSHRNLLAGAKSVASYLENTSADVLLAALPLSFDAGLSQLTTAFHVGARVVLLNYLLPRDLIRCVEAEQVTGITAVPPLWIQLSQQDWPHSTTSHLRYIANTGGSLPSSALERLRTLLPRTRCFLMYGLTEAFRATYLPPNQLDRRPGSIGKAIPNAEVLVLREDGTQCASNEPGELVQRGALVALGYWNDKEKSAERFRSLSTKADAERGGLVLPEVAVYSGDIVRADEEGYLYFVGRRDDMIKSSGYRISPTEIEEVLYSTGSVGECIAFGIPHEVLGQTICAIVTPVLGGSLEAEDLLSLCKRLVPAYMVPSHLEVRQGSMPRNPNGKIDRKAVTEEWLEHRQASSTSR